MRNAGWYIPYWRKPMRRGQIDREAAEPEEQTFRDDAQLEAVRRRWIERYRRTARSLALFGLSVGSGRADVQARYEAMRADGVIDQRELEDAYQHLLRVLPSAVRRKRKSRGHRRTAESVPHAADSPATGAPDDSSADDDIDGDDAESDESALEIIDDIALDDDDSADSTVSESDA